MKQFIVLAAILPILLLFMAQAVLEAGRSLRMSAAEEAIRAFCVEATYYDGGGPAEAEALRSRLAGIFGVDACEIYINLTKPDDTHIDWHISFPVGDIMAGAAFIGLSDAENGGTAQMSGTIAIARSPIPPPEPDFEADPDITVINRD